MIFFAEMPQIIRLQHKKRALRCPLITYDAIFSDFLFNQVVVPALGVADDEFAEEACEEQHTAENHHQYADVEVRVHTQQHRCPHRAQGVDLHADYDADGYHAYQEHQAAHQAEEVHRLLAELVEEPYRHQVQIAVDKPVHAELRDAELALAVLDDLLANPGETGVLGEVRDIAVHLAEHLDVLHHILPVRLQAAVHIMQLYARYAAGCGVEQLRRQILRQRIVVALLLPAAHQVKAVLGDHPVQFGNLVRRVLQVSVHRDDHIALRSLESAVQCGTLAVVPAEADAVHMLLVLLLQRTDDLPRVVRRTVVDEQQLITELVLLHHAADPLVQRGQTLCLVIQWYDD